MSKIDKVVDQYNELESQFILRLPSVSIFYSSLYLKIWSVKFYHHNLFLGTSESLARCVKKWGIFERQTQYQTGEWCSQRRSQIWPLVLLLSSMFYFLISLFTSMHFQCNFYIFVGCWFAMYHWISENCRLEKYLQDGRYLSSITVSEVFVS